MKSRRNRAFVTPSTLWHNAGRLSPLVAAAAVMSLAGIARAQMPQGGQVVNGQATINQNGNYTGIIASDGSIINWQSFNIGQGQTVQFFQPNAQSRVLNRVTGPDPSRIAGSLISNGIVYISNAAGVYFAHGSLVNVGGIYAAAGNITNADFLSNVNHFTGVTGTVENKGTINSASATLIGQRVANYGSINAPNGMVTMAAGDDVYVGEQNGQVFARVSGGAGDVGIKQAGQINAAGGKVVLGAGDMYAMAIDHPGSTKAKEIHLEGGRTGVVSVSGTLDASNQGAGSTGGKIEVLGEKVGVFGGHLNASGENGGGTILVGGDKQGLGTTRTADAVYVSEGSTIRADATTNGDGGKVVVWSDRFTNFQGKVSAKGGSQNGNGGFIETSGKKDLYMSGAADASAAHGRAGQWLLDPTDVTLSNAVTSGGVLGGGGVFTPGANTTANVNLGQITGALAGGTSVTINTTSAGGGNGDITLVDPLAVTMTGGGATLTLNAVRDIAISNTLTGTGAAGNELGLAFNAGRNVTISNAISINGGALDMNAAGTVAINAGITTGGGAFSLVNTGTSNLGANIDAGAGNVTFSSDLVLTSNVTLNGHNLTFNGTVNSDSLGTPRDLILNSAGSGVTRFNGDVGAVADLGTVTTNADGSTVLNAQFLKGMTVTLNDPFQVNVDGVVRGLTSVTFNSTIASESGEFNDLQVNSPLTTFNGAIGDVAGTRLGLFQTNDVGTTTINTGSIKAQRVNFKDNVVLGTTTAVSGTTSVAFAGTINSEASESNGLTISSPLVSLDGNIGQGAGGLLGLLRISQPGTTTLNAATISSVEIDFQSDVVLGSSSSMFGSIAGFAGKIDSQNGEANSLTVNAGILSLLGNIGQTAGGELGTLATGGGTTAFLYGLSVTATNVSFGSNVVIADTSNVRGTNSVAFGGTINSEAGEQNGLTIRSGGAMSIAGSVGQGSGGLLGLLRTETGGTLTINSGVISSSVIDFQSAVVLGSDLTLFGSTVTLAGSVNSQSLEANDLTIEAANAIISGSVGDAIGGTLNNLTTGGGTVTRLSGLTMNAGAFTFNNAVLAGGNTTLNATRSIRFASAVNSVPNQSNSLTMNSPDVSFAGEIGTGVNGELGSLIIGSGGVVTFGGTTILAGVVNIGGDLTLNQDTTITGNTSVVFGGRIDSQSNEFNDLLVNSPLTTFGGRIGESGSGASLGALRTNVAGTTTITASSITADTIDFADAVVLGATTTMHAATSVVFQGTLDSTASGAFGLTVESPLTRFSGRVGNAGANTSLGTLSTDSAGLTRIDTDIIKATEIDFSDVVVIGVDTAITGTTSVRFQLAVDSEANEANDLTVNSPLTNFDGVVGGGTNGALGALATDAPGTTSFAAAVTAGSLTTGDTVNLSDTITTTGDQTYNGQVFLVKDTVLSANDVTFNLTLNSGSTDRALTVNTTGGGITTFGTVGNINPLRSITTNADGRTVFAGSQMFTGGDQIFNDLVFLNSTVSLSANNVTFVGTVNSDGTPRSLNIDTTGNGITTFSAAVGDTSPLLRLTTNADGTTKINGLAITTTSTQAFNDTTVIGGTVGQTTVLSGGSVAFGGILNSDFTARALVINTSGGGLTTFNGAVGGTAPLASLVTNSDGSTRLNGGVIKTTGDQTFGDAVILGADATLTGNDITFSSTINSTALLSAAALTVNSTGNGVTTFGGAVGGTQALKSVTTNADGKTRIGASITTGNAGSQSYGDQVLIFRDSVLTDAGGTGISFGSTIDSEGSARSLSLLCDNASNASPGTPTIARISFGGNVGSMLALSQLRIGGNRTTVPSVATIVAGLDSSGNPISNFSISFNTTGAFTMGAMQKMTVVGNVTINAGGAVAVSDISALGNIAVNGSSIMIRTRPAGEYMSLINGGLVVSIDAGTDFVAGGTIAFSQTPGLLGGFGTANFATPDSTGISANLQDFAQRSLGGPVTAAQMHSGTTYLDLAAFGPSNTNIADTIAGALPSASQSGEVVTDTAVGRAERDELNEMGISTRSPETNQLLQFLLGRAMVSDVTDVGNPTAEDHSVTINRLPAAVVRRVLDTYKSVFWKTTYDPQTGQTSREPQTDHVVQVLNGAYTEYSAAAGAKADPVGFRAYLEAVPGKAEALNYLNGLRELFTELGYLGLTPTENRIARNRILRAVPIKGLTPTQLETAITTRQMGGIS